jgi:uncharacterized delta-60 repeat protein
MHTFNPSRATNLVSEDTVSTAPSRGKKWRRGLSCLLLLFAGWAVLPEQVWPQAQEAGAVAFQPDGKIVTVTTGGFAVARYHPDGRLDPSFGSGGKVVTKLGTPEEIWPREQDEESADSDPQPLLILRDGAGFVALQEDGKIVAAGGSDNGFAVVRYQPDGSLDPSFGSGGIVKTRLGTDKKIEDELHGMTLQTDGKIVVVGRSWQEHSNDIAMIRYNRDGSLDASFGTKGIVTTDSAPQRPPLGTRLNSDYDDAFAMIVQADNKLVVGGTALIRYSPNGSIDTSFGTGGWVRKTARALALQPDGKIVAVGASGSFALTRYNPDGSLDAGFGTGGTVTTQLSKVDAAGEVAIQADGKLVVVGTSFTGRSFDFALVRYISKGQIDAGFGQEGKVTSDFCAQQIEERDAEHIGPWSFYGGWRVRLQADGKILVMGTPSNSLCSGPVLVRYNSNGSLDTTFGENGRVTIATSSNGDSLIPPSKAMASSCWLALRERALPLPATRPMAVWTLPLALRGR